MHQNGITIKSLLCMPIKNSNNEVNAVVKLINRIDTNSTEITQFSDYDVQVVDKTKIYNSPQNS